MSTLRIEEGKYYRTRDGRKVGPVGYYGDGLMQVNVDGTSRLFYADTGKHRFGEAGLHLVAEWVDPAPQHTPHIVAVVINGNPAPAIRPRIHPDHDTALAEARRLAAANPGSEFGVYQRIGAVVAEVTLKEVA